MNPIPFVHVGIVRGKKITFVLFGDFSSSLTQKSVNGICQAELKNGKIVCTIAGQKIESAKELYFSPSIPHSEYFSIRDVIIGSQFHWERKEKQSFHGSLNIIIDKDALWAINIVSVEDYLQSVISSEMSPKSNIHLLKAHAVISRSWLLAQIEREKNPQENASTIGIDTPEEISKWYGRDEHTLFDVCADDHCQRYQGITKIHTDTAKQAVGETFGLVLESNGEICDARFSKSCGGITEAYENVWDNHHFEYLSSVSDYKFPQDDFNLNLKIEKNAEAWVKGYPHAFCNTNDKKILEQILLEFDQETKDFYRWNVAYTQEEISKLIHKKTGFDFGNIVDLIPLERGDSGRLIRLKIVGTKKELIVGKELEIRRILSKSHLYSSAFIVEKRELKNNIPTKFIIRGAGWGHGVGLCQIGAAVMAERGYFFDEILLHYYKDAQITKIY
jgi:stage II sporulation protein D